MHTAAGLSGEKPELHFSQQQDLHWEIVRNLICNIQNVLPFLCGGIAGVGTSAQCSPNTFQMCLASQGVVLGTVASAECHKYFPLFRNGSGLVAVEEEGGKDGWWVMGVKRGEAHEKSKIND